jgi:hypothetical protein
MRFIFDPLREQEQKLEKFRQSFRILTSDGQYPPERQQRLFQACKKVGLDWDEARKHIVPDAIAFLKRVITAAAKDGKLTAEEVAEIRRLQKRLLLTPEQAYPVLEHLFDLVERRLAGAIIDQAAYLGEADTVQSLKNALAAYDLPAERATRLAQQIDRQHQLAAMLTGNLPNIRASVPLYKDEVCHYDAAITVLTAGDDGELLQGRLLVTSQRLMILAPNGTVSATWEQCRAVEILNKSLVLVTSMESAMLLCEDPQYVATLIVAARRRYVPQALPQPVRADKRLAL